MQLVLCCFGGRLPRGAGKIFLETKKPAFRRAPRFGFGLRLEVGRLVVVIGARREIFRHIAE